MWRWNKLVPEWKLFRYHKNSPLIYSCTQFSLVPKTHQWLCDTHRINCYFLNYLLFFGSFFQFVLITLQGVFQLGNPVVATTQTHTLHVVFMKRNMWNLIREFKLHVYGKRQTSDSSWEFLNIENEQIKTGQNNSYG